MRRTVGILALALVPVLSVAQAAKLKMPDLSGLAAKATESVDISLDGDMLKTAGAFMGGGHGGDPEMNDLINGLEGIYVKVFTFDKPDMFSQRDVDAIVSQASAPGWKQIMSVRDKEDRVGMWLHDKSAGGGMLLVAAEPKELVIVNIAGNIDLEKLRKLQGRFGVPALPGVVGPASPPVPPEPAKSH
jgi:Domain of unknown function (DUF4252)